ncbi:insulinase family protein [Heliorestis acidaminivorans]|uniref:Insulinase family protein n=1 Tax=Heliorestis acidaminivorans TaxID=553427 RepID=A0A6I0F495_9FIRM|nr:pitrilysin family protein [Heliorestis acidaminivorans]KAB2954343.1 insulinase family protein [Heliorestis acidaminivorans]
MVRKEVLPNGVRIVAESIPHVRSVALGIWVATGSRDEEPAVAGVSHFLEHLLFKGTEKRSAKDLAEVLEAVGGQLNAFTSKEYTCYHAKILDEHFDLALDVLTDMFFNSRFNEEDIERERRVVLEEIKMYEDSPDEVVHELLSETMWSTNSLGKPILGTYESIDSLSRDMIVDHFHNEYTANRIVIAVAGRIDPDKVIAQIRTHFEKMEKKKNREIRQLPTTTTKVAFVKKDVEQVQLCIGTSGLAHHSSNIYALHILNNVIGGGASSRLFQEIRENRGLAYSVFSYHSSFSDAGLFSIYAGTSPNYLQEVLEISIQEMVRIKNEGITEKELKRIQDQIKGSMYLGLESVNSRMTRLGRSEILYGRYVTPEEVIEKIYNVTREDVLNLARQLWTKDQIALAIVGSKEPEIELAEVLHKQGM